MGGSRGSPKRPWRLSGGVGDLEAGMPNIQKVTMGMRTQDLADLEYIKDAYALSNEATAASTAIAIARVVAQYVQGSNRLMVLNSDGSMVEIQIPGRKQ